MAFSPTVFFFRIHMYDHVKSANQVIKNDHFIRDHPHDVCRQDRVWFVGKTKPLFNITHRFIAKVANQASTKPRQSLDGGNFELLLYTLDLTQRVCG